ncbi:MAG: translation elongation factor Ts, partial [Pseudomonadales bacterium]
VQKIGENISVRRLHRAAADNGVVGSYVHGNKKIAVVVELQGGDAELARDVAMHIAAMNSQFVSPDDVSQDLIAKERESYTVQAQDSGKPAEIIEKMVEGRVRKFLAEVSLTEQAFVKDPDVKVGKLVEKAGAKVLSFQRFEVGEGIAKEEVDFATEVAAQLEGDSPK